jgi:large subunit ribosomal protein L4
MKLTIKDIKGNSQGELEVKFPLIENGKGTQAVHDTVVAYRAAQRMGTACTKNVGEVAGSNKKPWRQKGTGRARAGSFASQLALRKALSARLKAGDVVVVDDLKIASPKTREFVGLMSALELKGTTLIVSPDVDKNLALASRNVAKVAFTTSDSLNTYDVLRPDKLLFTRGAFEKLEARLVKE